MTFPLWFGGGHSNDDDQRGDFGRRAKIVRSNTSADTDQALVARLRDGDARALREIVDEYGPSLLTLASAVTGSTELGDDVVQQMFIRLWDRRAELVLHGSLRQYLWRATRNQAISVRRHEQLLQRVANEWQRGSSSPVARNWGEQSLDAASVLLQVTALLESLPARCREIFLLHWRDSRTAAEIAELLGIGVEGVRNQILRAVKHLAANLRR